MRKRFSYISTFALTLALVFMVSGFVFPETGLANHCDPETQTHIEDGTPGGICRPIGNQEGNDGPGFLSKIFGFAADALLLPFAYFSILGLQIAKLIFWISGVLLNHVILFTIVNMSANLDKADVINIAWSKIRDLANMTFIFVLLYAAIKTILGLGSDTKKLIINVIVVAILINFSLFFTKVVIDASNILAVTFYDAMVPGALNPDDMINGGLANELKKPLKLGTIIDTQLDGKTTGVGLFEGRGLLITGLLGSIFVIVGSFVLFAMSFMLIIRFVVLIFVLILSPIAFMAFVLPGLKSAGEKWKDALFNQAFFAPIFFILIWIVLGVTNGILITNENASFAAVFSNLNGANTASAQDSADAVMVVMNFIIIIVLLVSSLIIAKSMSDKAGGSVGKLNKWVMGAAGGASFGLLARGGRSVIGSRFANMADNEELKKKAADGSIRARLQLAAANKVTKSSMDIRGIGLGGTLEAGKAKKGGFIQDQKDRAKTYEQYKPSKDAKDRAANETTEAKKKLNTARNIAVKESETSVFKHKELTEAEKQLEETRNLATQPMLLEGLSEADIATTKARRGAAVSEAEQQVKKEREKYDKAVQSYIDNRIKGEQRDYEGALGVEHEMANRMENMAKMAEDQIIRGTIPFTKKRIGITVPKFVPTSVIISGKNKAKAIRSASKGLSGKDELAKAYKKIAEEERGGEPEAEEPKIPTNT